MVTAFNAVGFGTARIFANAGRNFGSGGSGSNADSLLYYQ